MERSEMRSAIDELSLLAATVDHVPIKPFLALCNLVIQVLDKIGPTMAVLRQDIHHNIQRLENFHDNDPSIYWDVVEILKKEANEGNAKKGPTCSKAFDLGRNMEQAVEESYNITLKPWHGWISSAAYKVALKLVPDSKTLVNILKVEDEDDDTLKEEMQNLISLLMPVVERNKDILSMSALSHPMGLMHPCDEHDWDNGHHILPSSSSS
ncbi:hypothetical protein DH2020_034746 [Rehmannia glutinosa]|uniref:Glycolipid transfer protein domain-containing protein n=1 Tax=Rehmannia glutinosa TaxID=99300 RepID=A0ABR0VB17_REHGL